MEHERLMDSHDYRDGKAIRRAECSCGFKASWVQDKSFGRTSNEQWADHLAGIAMQQKAQEKP